MAAASIGSARCSSSSRVRYMSSSYQGLGFRVQGLGLPTPAAHPSSLQPHPRTRPPVRHRPSRLRNNHANAHAHTGGLHAGVSCGYVTFWKTASLTRTRCHRLTALRAQRHTAAIGSCHMLYKRVGTLLTTSMERSKGGVPAAPTANGDGRRSTGRLSGGGFWRLVRPRP